MSMRKLHILRAVEQMVDGGSWIVGVYKNEARALEDCLVSNKAARRIEKAVKAYYKGEYTRVMGWSMHKHAAKPGEDLRVIAKLDAIKAANLHPIDKRYHDEKCFNDSEVFYSVVKVPCLD